MPFSATLSRSRFNVVPDIYEATVVAVDEVESNYPRRDGSPMIDAQFEFRIDEGEFEGAHVRGWGPPFFTPDERCKLYTWVRAILHDEDALPNDYTFTDKDLIGRKVRILVQQTTDGRHAKVKDVLPFGSQGYV